MITVTTFLRRVPANSLEALFEKAGLDCRQASAWSETSQNEPKRVAQLISELDNTRRSRFLADSERISGMSDDPGQTALFGVVKDRPILESLPNRHARSAWAFVQHQEAFRRAEEARFSDERRRGRTWSGFVTEPGLQTNQTAEAIENFKVGLRAHFGSQNAHVELFKREKQGSDGQLFSLAQATVYRDGLADDMPEFVGGDLAWRPHIPVYEAAVTYEPESGSLEVVGGDRDSREHVAQLFAAEILGDRSKHRCLPVRYFDLDVLLRPFDFPTDPADCIESVRLTELRLQPLDTRGERLTLECSRQCHYTIWDMAARRFGAANPLAGGWTPTRAKLVVSFQPTRGSTDGRVLPLTVTMPHGCDLKDRTVQESMIGSKYLKRWHLLKDV